ncbi:MULTISPECIES: plasmid pRiA4b ORF-3 family protein [Microbacterium]|uniref:plasmid pRiA4b ORF-3 family protein n=1 Tax=Microbacterium TaxID=33882 RepID=UPI00051A74A4|nr:plasmid pRiA4b ORF-3 family protein [Microbacterium profundi]
MTRYRLRSSLVGSEPEIWRTFEIEGSASLRMLHLALQTIMGWRESHLHAFTDADPYDRAQHPSRRWEALDFESDEGTLSEDDFTVDDVLQGGRTLWYEYDFGDGWIHRLDVIEQLPSEPHLTTVVLLDGANRGPFEDSGGVGGYAEKIAIAADTQHPEHESIVDWIDTTVGPWAPREPGMFDLVGVQSELNLMFNPRASGISPNDMSGLVKVEAHRRRGDVDETSPIADFASQLPPPIRSELRQHLQHTGVLGPSAIDADTAARIIRPFAWLMDAVGADGLDLTAAGWMPQSTVLAGMTELGWITDWIGKGNREDVTPPIAVLRETAQRIGLVRVQKGRLLLSAAAKKALGDAPAQLRLIAEGLYRKLSDAETDAAVLLLLAIADGTPREDRWRSVAFGLEMCGWQSSSGWRFTEQDIGHATFWTQRVLNQLGDAPRLHRFDEESPLLRPFAREALR